MLDTEFAYFKEHQLRLFKEHPGKFLVIRGEEVIGVYDSQEEAYFLTKAEHELGTFLIQRATPEAEAYSATFRSRARI